MFTGNYIDDAFWDELEERLILADIGAPLAEKLLENVKGNRSIKTPAELQTELRKRAVAIFPAAPDITASKPRVTLVVGVNGAGKTTTIAKIAKKAKNDGQNICLCAADTFRAAAIDQLKSWADRLGVTIIAPQEGSDPAAAAFDAVSYGVRKEMDAVIIDTAGRLHTKHNLMEELKKINRVIGKAKAGAPDEVLLVLDGTAGQNALVQAKTFNEAVGITSIAITKLDGTAKGGIVLRIAYELGIPVRWAGLGEKEEDLIEFDPGAYVDALFTN